MVSDKKIFKLFISKVWGPAVIELTTPGSAVRIATNCAKGPGPRFLYACVISLLFSHPSVKTCILDAQKNRLNETILLSTHNICFGLER